MELPNLNVAWLAGLALGLLAGFWSKAKEFLHRIFSLLFVSVDVYGSEASTIVAHLRQHAKAWPPGDRSYNMMQVFIRPRDTRGAVLGEWFFKQRRILWINYRPVVMSHMTSALNGIDNKASAREGYSPSVSLTYIRGTVDVEKLLFEAVERHNAQRHSNAYGCTGHGRFFVQKCTGSGAVGRMQMTGTQGYGSPSGSDVRAAEARMPPSDDDMIAIGYYRLIGWEVEQIGAYPEVSPLSWLALSPAVEDAFREARAWKDAKDWYYRRAIPWRRGWQLKGPPGSGKSSLATALGYELDMPIKVFDLASMSNREFDEFWAHAQSQSPIIVLFEDIDTVFDGRTNIAGEQGGGLTFDCVLNAVSGVKPANGIFLLITTNRPEALDPALVRPGRIDRVLEVGVLDERGRRKIAERILDGWPEDIARLVYEGEGDVGAAFTNRCVEVALERFEKTGLKGPQHGTPATIPGTPYRPGANPSR